MPSNIFRSDYAGSKECRFCHAEIYAAWERSPMRNMTRRAGHAKIRAPFDGATFRLRNDSVTMDERGGRRFMTITNGAGAELYRVTKVIGGRYREDFVGIDVTGAADPVTDKGRGAEKILPASWVFSTGTWRYKGYSVMVPERPGLRAGPIWANNCISCHNTLPYSDLLFDDLFGAKAPSYQGTVSDDILPAPLMWRPRVRDAAGLGRRIVDEIAFLGGPRPSGGSLGELLLAGMTTMRRRFAGQHLVEVGVGCEACHGGSRAHVDDPTVLPTFEPTSPVLDVGPPEGRPTRAQALNRVCARCHTVLFSAYPYTWEGRLRDEPDPGGSSINSGEARDFLLSPCARELTCVDCHDPHTEDDPARLRTLEGLAGNTLCLRCHRELGGAEALARHSHHAPNAAGAACVACHMPKKNMGLGYGLTAYHRIGSPNEPARVQNDRPLECAICHPDKSVAEIVGRMESWWGRRYDRAALRSLYGDLDGNAMDLTLQRGKAHEQAVAVVVLGERREKRAVPLLAPLLAHDYPLVRFFVKHALETITGAPVPIDPNEAREVIVPAAARWLNEWAGAPVP